MSDNLPAVYEDALPAKVGRPTKLTAEVHQAIISAMEDGATIIVAIRSVGVASTTYRRWMEQGKSKASEHEHYRLFRVAVKRARATAELNAIKVIKRAQNDNWAAAAWFLERSFPERWSRGERSKPTEKATDPLRVIVTYKELKQAEHELDEFRIKQHEKIQEHMLALEHREPDNA